MIVFRCKLCADKIYVNTYDQSDMIDKLYKHLESKHMNILPDVINSNLIYNNFERLEGEVLFYGTTNSY